LLLTARTTGYSVITAVYSHAITSGQRTSTEAGLPTFCNVSAKSV
jgi:hypothetical protein